MQETRERVRAAEARLATIDKILDDNERDASRLISILQQIQEEQNYLSREAIDYVATSLNVPVSRVYGVATFYARFSLSPKGKHIIRLCDGTACHVKKSRDVIDRLYEKLKLSPDKSATDDMLFSIELVSCLGACGLAPVMVVDEEVHGQTTPDEAEAIVDKIIAAEKGATSVDAEPSAKVATPSAKETEPSAKKTSARTTAAKKGASSRKTTSKGGEE